jgi:hypothetical protein
MSSVSVRLSNAKFGILFASAAGGVDEVVTTEGGWHGNNLEKEKSFANLKSVPRIILEIG